MEPAEVNVIIFNFSFFFFKGTNVNKVDCIYCDVVAPTAKTHFPGDL